MDRWLFLSPHLDDAVLSCGGLIARLASSATVCVLTVFTGAPLWGPYSGAAQWLHGVSGYSNACALSLVRKREDRAALRGLNVQCSHLSFRDAVYRRSAVGEWLYQGDLQVAPKIDDEPLIRRLADAFRKLAGKYDTVVYPLGIGGHVDHQIVRTAAVQADLPCVCYKDVPYCLMKQPVTVAVPDNLKSVNFALGAAQVESWLRAVQRYRTQLPMLDQAVGSIALRLREYAAQQQQIFVSAGEDELLRRILRTIRRDEF